MNVLVSLAAAPGLTGPAVWLAPAWDVPMLALAAALAGGYAWGLRRLKQRGLAWSAGRTAAWTLGLVSLLIVTSTGIAANARLLIWAFTLQTLVLLLITPVLLVYGRPVALAADGLTPPGAGRLLRAMNAPSTRLLTSPVLGPLLVPLALSTIYFTPLLSMALQHQWMAELLQLGLLAVGLVLALGLVGAGTEADSSLALGASVAIGLVELLTDAIPGMVVRLQTHLLAPTGWAGRHRSWGPSPLTDQQHAGALLWFAAEAADLPFLVILVRRWIRADERDAAAADHELDLGTDPHRSAQPYPAPAAVETSQPVADRPWWETDPSRLAGHRLAREYRRADPDDKPS